MFTTVLESRSVSIRRGTQPEAPKLYPCSLTPNENRGPVPTDRCFDSNERPVPITVMASLLVLGKLDKVEDGEESSDGGGWAKPTNGAIEKMADPKEVSQFSDVVIMNGDVLPFDVIVLDEKRTVEPAIEQIPFPSEFKIA
ncbi:hypothetical protein BLNAU_19335 [Blattamonas nauphoetae]|uniref:Uncharacterized protein n=1 Tax=Blattamonas nauphoetae TaxID=2049346 RepID=A0ABQ9X1R5_9EUKA|nr:hypothetical protein BLNAU_19335 [Blattamonas nauphoetae]